MPDWEVYGARRSAVLEAMGPGVMVIASAPVAMRNNDVEHEYRQHSDLFYLTGFDEPESVLILSTVHREHRAVLFMRERDPEREIWDGPRLGVERARDALGVDVAYPIRELDDRLADYLEGANRAHYRVGVDRRFDDRFLRALDVARTRARRGSEYPTELVDPGVIVHERRMHKSAVERATMRRAAEITRDAHIAAMQVARPGRFEYEVEAEILRVFRAGGAERPAYGSIVGSGPNATILHYRKNDRRLGDNELLLIDAGAEYGYYASDVTRTFPVSGKFTSPQRAVYELVLRAQIAAIEAVRPGTTLEAIHSVAVDSLVDGLLALGIIAGPREGAVERGEFRRYYMHRTSHWLGMDVHDVGRYHEAGAPRVLSAGMVLTIEPGLYLQANADVASEYKGIGVRIEDDILVTPEGHENLTFDIPKEVAEVERILTSRG